MKGNDPIRLPRGARSAPDRLSRALEPDPPPTTGGRRAAASTEPAEPPVDDAALAALEKARRSDLEALGRLFAAVFGAGEGDEGGGGSAAPPIVSLPPYVRGVVASLAGGPGGVVAAKASSSSSSSPHGSPPEEAGVSLAFPEYPSAASVLRDADLFPEFVRIAARHLAAMDAAAPGASRLDAARGALRACASEPRAARRRSRGGGGFERRSRSDAAR